MSKCATHKKTYQSHELAVEALIGARTRFDYPQNSGPIAVYKCEDCGYYHLTSQGKMNETLQKHLMEGKIQLQKEGNAWLNKLKKK
jgi:hypothetical protein